MENSNNKDFEQFVQQNADQYRMFPSDKVWKGIHKSLHTRRRWYGIGLGLLLLTTGATVTWVMLTYSNKNIKINTVQEATANDQPADALEKVESSPTTINFPIIANAQPVAKSRVLQNHELSQSLPIAEVENSLIHLSLQTEAPLLQKVDHTAIITESAVMNFPMNIQISDQATDNTVGENFEKTEQTINDNRIASAQLAANPMSIESVLNSYKHAGIKRRLSWEIYFVPTISYRKLTENTAFLRSAQSNNSPFSYAALHDVNSAVTHKPDMGMEFGFATGYPLSKKLKLLGGLQFNVSKYDIRAYVHTSEVATIALSSGPGNNSVSAVTNYRNFDGYRSDWLHTLYLSVSAPLGAELKLGGSDKSYWGISGTLQPSFILRDRAYLISTDYKNYAKVPSLIRNWNVNTGFEIFAGYSTGVIKWKVGPQVRYQILSSFEEKYPVREHLFDFGLKVGIMLNN